jgi:hypothetical protein
LDTANHSYRLNVDSIFKIYRAVYYDVRHAVSARDALTNRLIRGARLRVLKLGFPATASSTVPFPSEPSDLRGRKLSTDRNARPELPTSPSPARARNLSVTSFPSVQSVQRRRTGSSPPDSPHHASFSVSPSSGSATTNNTPRKLATRSQQIKVEDIDVSPRRLYFDPQGKVRPRSISVSAANQEPPEEAPRGESAIKETSAGLEQVSGRRPSNRLFFDGTGNVQEGDWADYRRHSLTEEHSSHATSATSSGTSGEYSNQRQSYPFANNAPGPAETYYWMAPHQPCVPVPVPGFEYGYVNCPTPTPTPLQHQDAMHPAYYYSPASPAFPAALATAYGHRGFPHAPVYDYSVQPAYTSHYPVDYYPHSSVAPAPQYAYAPGQQPIPSAPPVAISPPADRTQFSPPAPAGSVPVHNQINLPKIESGMDTRTTVMIKNIPNKMTDRDLIAFIEDVCPRRIDFLYLRMDFQNGMWASRVGRYAEYKSFVPRLQCRLRIRQFHQRSGPLEFCQVETWHQMVSQSLRVVNQMPKL